MAGVKRRYNGDARKAQAERIRQTLLDAAREQLLSIGYAGTSISKVAQNCGVSVESVYKRFPGKPALLRAVVSQALRGTGTIAAEIRSDSLPSEDLETLLGGWGRLAAEVAPRVAPILLLVRAAAGQDPELIDLARELDDNRRIRMTDNARRLVAAGHLRRGPSVERAADILWTYSSPELYDLLVVQSKWDIDQYAAFISAGLASQFER